MVISAIIASLITIGLSATITNIQSQTHQTQTYPKQINQIQTEIHKITRDGTITQKEKINFRKMLQYHQNYQTQAQFNNTEPCITVRLQSTDKTIQTGCIN